MSDREPSTALDAHVGQRIRECRKAAGLTQKALAPRIGCSFQQLQKYETGQNRVAASRLCAIADALGVSVLFFFAGAGDTARDWEHALVEAFRALPPPKRLTATSVIRDMAGMPQVEGKADG